MRTVIIEVGLDWIGLSKKLSCSFLEDESCDVFYVYALETH